MLLERVLVQLHKSYGVFIEHCVLALRRRTEGGARGAKEKTLPAFRSPLSALRPPDARRSKGYSPACPVKLH